MTVYRWRGVNAIGQQKTGRADWPDLAAEVERRFKSGWRSLVVCSGEGPVPPPAIGPAGMVAAIERHRDTGKRVVGCRLREHPARTGRDRD